MPDDTVPDHTVRDDTVIAAIRAGLREIADPSRADGQQRYMKSAMPYLGVRVPDARRVARRAGADVTEPATLRDTALALWNDATYREERYAAIALIALPAVAGRPASLPVIEHMIRTGQWWDYVDELAHRLGEVLRTDRPGASTVLRRWSRDGDRWIRRSAILAQLGHGADTDLGLLCEVIEPNRDHPDFFVRKAIGWALRDASRRHPDWVRDYLAEHRLSPLSYREASKRL